MLLKLWSHVQSHVPRSFEGLTLVGPHPRMRFLEYVAVDPDVNSGTPTVDHPLHADTPLQDAGSYSCITVLVYLNSDFEGGELDFEAQSLSPREGLVAIFPHRWLHRSRSVTSGCKRLLKLSVLYADPMSGSAGSAGSCKEADLEERLPFIMAATSARQAPVVVSAATAQEGYFQREALWKHTLSMVGTKKDEFQLLLQKAKKLNSDDALEKLLDFIVQNDVNSEPWAEELLTSAFMSLAHTLQIDRFKLKAYQALDSAKVLHGSELCILLGETLMRDFEAGATLEIRLAALHGYFTLLTSEKCRSSVVVKALRDPEAKIRLRALQGVVSEVSSPGGPGVVYKAALESLVKDSVEATEVALALQALSLL